jgi:hypothetical protein
MTGQGDKQAGKKTPDHSIMCIRSQSGQIQVGPLLIPQMFSLKQAGQIWKPQVQLQQKGTIFRQQMH